MSCASQSSKGCDFGVLLAGDVDAALAVDLVDPADELGPLRPGDDLDPRGRVEREQLAVEVERDPQLATDLGEPAPRREADALVVAELDEGEQGVVAVGGGPARELREERRAEPAAAVLGRHERPDERLWLPRLLHRRGRPRRARRPRRRAGAICLRGLHPGAEVLDRDRVVGDDCVAEREPALELGVVAGRADLGHAATIRPNTYGGDLVSTWSVLRQSCKPRSPVGLVNPPGNQVSADNELALAA